jgi:insulysin
MFFYQFFLLIVYIENNGLIIFINMMEITKSIIDDGEYELIELKNGITVLLNSDKKLQHTFVSTVVHTGYYNDPIEFQGLSHFLEHMLFMGSKNYPNINEFEKYIAENGGVFNALTEEETTTYYFKIVSIKLVELLNIFSSFFICPSFDEKTLNKEIKNVDSEFKLKYNDMTKTIFPILTELYNKSHPATICGYGNLKLLNKPNLRETMINYYKKWYCSENITKYVTKCFNKVPKCSDTFFKQMQAESLTKYKSSPFVELFEKYKYPYIQYFKDTDIPALILIYPTTSNDLLSNEKPYGFYSHLIGHESEGSILFELKKRNLATSLLTGINNNSLFGYLFIAIDLTELGNNNWQEIINVVTDYLHLLNNIQYDDMKQIYEEIRNINNMLFNSEVHSDMTDKVISVSKNMKKYTKKHLLDYDYYLIDFDESVHKILKKWFSQLSNPIIFHSSFVATDNTQLKLSKPRVPQLMKTKNYVMNYSLDNYNIKNTNEHYSLSLPKKNKYISTQLTTSKKEFTKNPIKKNKLWYQIDTRYQVSKTRCNIMLYVQKNDEKYDYELHLAAMIFVEYITELLNNELYYVETAMHSVELNYKNCSNDT